MPSIKTGETVNVSIDVDIQYRCSFCGEENLIKESISGSAYTSTMFGIRLNRGVEAEARDNLAKKVKIIADQENPQRFRTAAFTCKCKNCGKAEPWAKLNYERLETFMGYSIGILIPSIIISIVGLCMKSTNGIAIFSFLVAELSAVALVSILLYKHLNIRNKEQEIAALPPESIPVIFLYSEERHRAAFRKMSDQKIIDELTKQKTVATDTTKEVDPTAYGKWACKHCGTQNSAQFSQCKKCGKYKSL